MGVVVHQAELRHSKLRHASGDQMIGVVVTGNNHRANKLIGNFITINILNEGDAT